MQHGINVGENIILISVAGNHNKANTRAACVRVFSLAKPESIFIKTLELYQVFCKIPLTVNVKLALKRFGTWLTLRSHAVSNKRNNNLFNFVEEGVVELSVGAVLKIAEQKIIGVFGSIASLAHFFAKLYQLVQFWRKERPVVTVLCLLPDLVSLSSETNKVALELNRNIYQLASIATQNFNLRTVSLIKQSAVLVKSVKECANSRITEGLLDLLAKDCQGFSTLFSSLLRIDARSKRANLISCIVEGKKLLL